VILATAGDLYFALEACERGAVRRTSFVVGGCAARVIFTPCTETVIAQKLGPTAQWRDILRCIASSPNASARWMTARE